MQKNILTTLLACAVCLLSWGGLPLRRAQLAVQSNGDTLTVYRAGCEHIAFFRTTDGVPLLRDDFGNYCYAFFNTDGTLRNSLVKAASEDQRTADAKVVAQAAKASHSRVMSVPAVRSASQQQAVLQAKGSPKIPILLVAYSDVAFDTDNDAAAFSRQLNEAGYTANGNMGSVRDYFIDQSDGQFSPEFDVYGPYVLSKARQYYGANAVNGSLDVRGNEMAREAVALAAAAGVDFSPYRVNGQVPTVGIIYAGAGEQNSAEADAADYINAKFVTPYVMTADTVRIYSYFCVNEALKIGTNEPIRDGIGVFCHEFGHVLGLPDFYDTGGSGAFGMDAWSVMDIGMYWGNGYRPMGYTAYEREFMGWIDIPELTGQQTVTIDSLHKVSSARAYKVVNDDNPSEYYLLENRQPSRWFPAAMGTGLLITHVDYDASIWAGNRVNADRSRQRMTFFAADNSKLGLAAVMGTRDYSVFRGDLYPGLTGNASFTDDTQPAAVVYQGGKMSKPLYNIVEREGKIYLSYLQPDLLSNIVGAERTEDEAVRVYSVDGRYVATLMQSKVSAAGLKAGVYIIKGTRAHEKIIIK